MKYLTPPPTTFTSNVIQWAILTLFVLKTLLIILPGKNVLVTGGTQGIGAAGRDILLCFALIAQFMILTIVACHFAELGANVTIAGRNVKEAEVVLGKLRMAAPSKDAKLDFVQFDASLKSKSIAFADQMSEKYKTTGLYALVMTHGAAANGDPRKETSECHERYASGLKV